ADNVCMSEAEPGQTYFYGALPVFLVDDVIAAAEYYRDTFGFEVDFIYGQPAFYASVSRDDAIINFRLSVPEGRRNGMAAADAGNGVDAFILVTEVQKLYDDLIARGASIAAVPI